MQVVPDLGSIVSMKQTFCPRFRFQGAWLHLALLGACVLFWVVGQRMCSASPVDSVPAWSNAEDCVGIGLLHPSHWCFSASSEQGCFLSRLLAQEPGGCWTLNKVSRRHRNHSVLMHLITHKPEYNLTWQLGLSCVKQLMKFQLVQGRKKKPKRVNLWCSVFSSLKGGGGWMLPSPSPTVLCNSCLNCDDCDCDYYSWKSSGFFEGWFNE